MAFLRDLYYKEFVDLIDFLEGVSEGGAIESIGKFFPQMTAVQEMELGYIIDSKNEEAFNRFKSDYPDMEIDAEGKSTPIKKDYWEITEKSLNYTFQMALEELKGSDFRDKSSDKANTQIYNAKTLSCLKNMEKLDPSIYYFKRKLFIEKNASYISDSQFNDVEDILKRLGVKHQSFMNYVVEYCKEKKYKNFRLFIDHLFRRIDILSLDLSLKSASNKEFLESIKSVVDKNN
jgi:hypothetical protein